MSLPPPGFPGSGPSFSSGAGAPITPSGPITPAGWYPDPWGHGAHRWWDGTAWTHHLTAAAPPAQDPGKLVAAAEASAVWLKRTLYVLPVAQMLSFVLILGALRQGFEDLRDSIDSGGAARATPFQGGAVALGQLFGLVGTVALVLRMVWLYRATKSARALGLATRREPGLACAGWLIPIVNTWWPYQGVSDLLPLHRRPQAKVLRWWLAYILGSIAASVGLVVTIIASFVRHSSTPAWIAGVMALAVFGLWAWFEVGVIDRVQAAHRELLGSRHGTDRPFYP